MLIEYKYTKNYVCFIHTYDNLYCRGIFFHITFTMKSNEKDYIDYSHQDAPDILDKVLTYFFLDDNDITTYSLPKKHFDNIKKSNTFADTRRYFTIITGTDLVTNKIVSSYRTNQGTRYLLRKDYHQLIERMTRKNKREMVRQSQFPPKQHSRSSSSPQKSPFVEYLKIQNYNDDSSDDNNGSLPKSDQPIVNKTPSTTKNRANTIQKTFQPIQMMIYPLSKRNLRSWLLKLKQRWTMRSLP